LADILVSLVVYFVGNLFMVGSANVLTSNSGF
jgi:hypothetical protein